MANWCFVDMEVATKSEEDADKLESVLRAEEKLAAEEDRMVYIGSNKRYVNDFYIVESDGPSVTIQGEVRWGISYEEMSDIVSWLESIVPCVRITCRQDESGCGVFGDYTYENGKLLYRYIPSYAYPEYDEKSCVPWYQMLEDALKDFGVVEEIEV